MNMPFYDKKCKNSKFIVGIFLIRVGKNLEEVKKIGKVGILVSLSLIKA